MKKREDNDMIDRIGLVYIEIEYSRPGVVCDEY